MNFFFFWFNYIVVPSFPTHRDHLIIIFYLQIGNGSTYQENVDIKPSSPTQNDLITCSKQVINIYIEKKFLLNILRVIRKYFTLIS